MQLHLSTPFLPISLNSLDHEGVRLLSPRDSQITSKTSLQVPLKPYRWRNRAHGGARWRSYSLYCSVLQLISSGAQLGRSGICVAFGVVFFYFGSVVGPWLYLDDVMLYSCIVWSGDCKPTMYLFPLLYYMGCCEDYLTCDIAFNAAMPLSRASTRGRYSRIEALQVGNQSLPRP